MMNLKDQVAIVTGGGGGIGEGVCLCLARAGFHVVVSDVDEGLAQAVARKVEETGRKSLAIKTDVRYEDQCNNLVATTLEQFGRLDTLVCSAGTAATHLLPPSGNASNVETIPVEAWDLTIDVNLKGVFLCNRAVIPYFKEQKRGRIINIASDAARKGDRMIPVYGASKAGVVNLTQAIALQCAEFHINVNSICPGLIWTPLWAAGVDRIARARPDLQGVKPEDIFNALVNSIVPFKRPQTAEDIGNLVVFLASDLASEITGQAINVDGGTMMN